ncbi:MAG: DUF2889 domain-containing protein [Burkholderiales bacterium]|nr:DUF2889 domain-containing protein [Burkholderiales bacterium]
MTESPLPQPAPRQPLHTRRVQCQGYRRNDGLYDIEGVLIDTKNIDFNNMDRGHVKPGGHIHEMWIRLTVDIDLNVIDVEAKSVFGPYMICGDITPNFKRLKGLAIKQGWTKKTREYLGGTKGCTHMVELLGPIATTAFQTTYHDRVERDKGAGREEEPALVGSCHAYAPDSIVVMKRFPKLYSIQKNK